MPLGSLGLEEWVHVLTLKYFCTRLFPGSLQIQFNGAQSLFEECMTFCCLHCGSPCKQPDFVGSL
eukprot:6111237-Amphidinium_carterae.1